MRAGVATPLRKASLRQGRTSSCEEGALDARHGDG